jgi:hypothetical protein
MGLVRVGTAAAIGFVASFASVPPQGATRATP